MVGSGMISFFKDKAQFNNNTIMTVFTVLIGISAAHAEDLSQCSQSFYGRVYPEVTIPKLSHHPQALCTAGFAAMPSVVSRTQLWSAEYLGRKRLQEPTQLDREHSFHDE